MPSPTEITVPQLSRLIGLPGAPTIIDVRPLEELQSDPRLLPAARHVDSGALSNWCRDYSGQRVVVCCRDGGHVSQGTAAWLRNAGVEAETLEGGFEAWREAGQLLLRTDPLPERDEMGRTVWVTRARPKIVRIACPWLIRRFIDPKAVFLFVAPPEVPAVAERFKAAPFDTGHGLWNDRGDLCTFDVMLDEFNLRTEPLLHLARIVRGADTGELDLTPQSAGLLAASLGYSRMYRDDLAQLEAALSLYDAFYRWCRDAVEETHG
jgi:rhodanese-related sulfurtransferase